MYDNLIFCVRNGERLLNILFDTHENKKKGEERKKLFSEI